MSPAIPKTISVSAGTVGRSVFTSTPMSFNFAGDWKFSLPKTSSEKIFLLIFGYSVV
jgi:hypothetical protein